MTALTEQTPADPRTGSAFHRFFRGFGLPFQGLQFMFRHPRLWTYALVPVLITLVLLAVVFVALLAWVGDLTALIWARPEAWYLQLLWYPLQVLVFLILFAVGAVALPGLISSPFNDALSERTEALALGGVLDEALDVGRLVRDVGRTLLDQLLKIGLLLLGHLLILVLLVVPVAGQLLYPLVAGTWNTIWLGMEYLEYPMSRNNYRFATLRHTVSANLALTMGFGFAVFLILLVPVLNLLFVPVAVVGGTLLYARLQQAGALPAPPTTR